ncbi:glycosyltransferase [Fibrobacter sp. UWP2]|uniref:glycosyltransferase n=1 Tax=Fibrobacter sp. UWP2 TaxID=1896216 RepID=UPI00116038E0|nr:glycosyltransferase [Fibrobacter sp. UWP2]
MHKGLSKKHLSIFLQQKERAMPNKPKSILFWPDVYKEQGHWLPTLKWAQVLHNQMENQEHAYSVNYMGIQDCASIISGYDNGGGHFPFHTILENMYPEGYTTASHSSPNERWKTWHIWAILYSQYFELIDKNGDVVDSNIEFKLPDDARMPSKDLIEDAKSIWKAWTLADPNMLVGGYFTSLETLLFYWIYGFEKVEEETEENDGNDGDENEIELDSNEDEDDSEEEDDGYEETRTRRTDLDFVISTTYLRHPQDDPAVRAKLNLLAFSKPELYKIINMATRGKVSTREPNITLDDFVAPLESFNELIPCPREYDYDHYEHGELVRYVDPCILSEQPTLPHSIDSDGETVIWKDEEDDNHNPIPGFLNSLQNVIFVSAGSQVLDYEDKAKNLFHSMCKAMQAPQMADYTLLLAVGSKLVNSDEWDDYDKSKIRVVNWVPQRDLLAKNGCVSCAIIHGGLASIKECIYFNRKFIICPMGKDQIDNALRLKHLGIDNTLQMSNVNPESLLDAINRVTTDYRLEAKQNKLSWAFQTLEDEDSNPPSGSPSDKIVTGFKIIREILNAQDSAAPQPNQGEMR